MKLYLIQHDSQSYYVEARSFGEAIVAWQCHVQALWAEDDVSFDTGEEPESVARVHDEAVIRALVHDGAVIRPAPVATAVRAEIARLAHAAATCVDPYFDAVGNDPNIAGCIRNLERALALLRPRRAEAEEAMRRSAVCYLILGTDKSILMSPYWYREHAEKDCPKDCSVVAARLTFDDRRPQAKRKRR